ncbi:hypothetical protein, partial [Streptomyces sp. NPDC004830]
TEEEIGEYSGTRKEIRPVTIATYQVLTTRRNGSWPTGGPRHCSVCPASWHGCWRRWPRRGRRTCTC